MGFEYDDGNVSIVVLGGTNKKTGLKNPTELTGYFLRKETIETKFGVKPLYVFKTKDGDKGLIGSGNLNKLMETKVVGLLTHVVDTGTTKDVGKGNPMKVFKVGQDRSASLDNSTMASYASNADDESFDDSDSNEEEELISYQAPKPPVTKAQAPSADRQARVQALLNARK